jgi:DNA polymerase I-like protein with 3'-5' exonuclease and polymerase domains
MAQDAMAHKIIQRTELPRIDKDTGKPAKDGTTDLPYATLPLKETRRMRRNWFAGVPEYEKGWKREINEWRAQGYLCEPVTGRRRDFLDGENPNELVNFKVQGAAAGLMNKALVKLYDHIPPHRWGPGTGIVNQCHDAIVIECPASEGPKVARLLERCMNQSHPSLPGVDFTATADIATSWDKVG